MTEENLFERLRREAGCQFISDLRLPASHAQVMKALLRISAAEFPREQWRELAGYCMGEEPPEKCGDYRGFLLDKFKNA